MCGIAGIYHYARADAVDRSSLERMNGSLVHRGPDDSGLYVDGAIGLAMRRLSVIDVASGHQPMANADRSAWVVFNGEIYNFQELRAEMAGQGRSFRTRSDTEVLLQLYDRMGVDFVKRLRGMFAFSLWDARNKRLILARDRMGEKPLLYSVSDGRLSWASEMQSLLQAPGVSRDIDPQAIDLYLGLQYIPSPHTIFRSIQKLPPGHLLICEDGRVRVERYWELPLTPQKIEAGFTETKESIRHKLEEAVRLRMVSDVPVGAFLSGGVDSTCVVAAMSRVSQRPVKTFAIGFEEQDFSELAYARISAAHFGTDHTEFVVKPEMTDVLPMLARHYGEPFGDSSALPTYFVSRESRCHVTVALTGDGGDENFAGYNRYRPLRLMGYLDRSRWASLAVRGAAALWPASLDTGSYFHRSLRILAEALPEGPFNRYRILMEIFSDRHRPHLYSGAMQGRLRAQSEAAAYLGHLFERASALDPINQLLHLDLSSYLPECLMAKVDIASMANSLETRAPFLDHEFIEYVAGLPGAWKLRRVTGTKWILREAFRDLLPPAILKRRKMGFAIPVDDWFRGKLNGFWREHVLSERALRRGYFDPAYVRRLIDEHTSGGFSHGNRLWSLLMLELWHENFAPEASIN